MRYHDELFNTPEGTKRTQAQVEEILRILRRDFWIDLAATIFIPICFVVSLMYRQSYVLAVLLIGLAIILAYRVHKEYWYNVSCIHATEGAVFKRDNNARWGQIRVIVADELDGSGITPPDIAISGWKFDYEISKKNAEIVYGTPVFAFDIPETEEVIRNAARQYGRRCRKISKLRAL